VSFQRKKIRLLPSRYIGKQIYFLTLCCEDRRPIFANESLGHWLVTELLKSAAEEGFAIHAYCVMPDHVHVLAEGLTETCHLVRFISSFKQQTAFCYKKKMGSRLWQSRYYDHILRKPMATDAVAWYIWLNPVRKGLCPTPQDYALSGSLTVDWRSRCSSAHDAWLPPWKAQENAGLKPGATFLCHS
jgi:putative transposase